jgi:hypothetical protein
MKLQYQATGVKLVLVLILFNTLLNSQGLNVVVYFQNDFTISGELLSVGDSSIVVQWNRPAPPQFRPHHIPVVQIRTVLFTKTIPGDASTLTKVGGAVAGMIVGGFCGFMVGDALFPPPSNSIVQIKGGAICGAIVGTAAGGFIGGAIVNPSNSREIRLDPNIPQQKDSLRVYLHSQ